MWVGVGCVGGVGAGGVGGVRGGVVTGEVLLSVSLFTASVRTEGTVIKYRGGWGGGGFFTKKHRRGNRLRVCVWGRGNK